ncbi:MAG: hypothetical protein P1U30_04275 [Phycisphaerales bacterium]|nr:hypothetical protein [Phycisphaerales bacterium]
MSDTPNTPDETTGTGSVPEPSVDATPDHVSQSCAKAPLNPKWSIKLGIITFFVIGFGALGLYDATVKYPARGERFADWAKWQYLDAAKNASSEQFGLFERETSVTDPESELARLKESEERRRNATDAQNQSSNRRLRATMYNTRLEWLQALQTVSQLTPEYTTIENPGETLTSLQAKWTSADSIPKPLKSYDIPSQWGILVICWGVGAWMLLNIFKVITQKFSWDAETMTFTVPGGIEITPAHLEEVDKRKWDKFIVFLKLNSTHPSHAGKEIKVDTYQHALVEDWILAMEKKAMETNASGSQEAGE